MTEHTTQLEQAPATEGWKQWEGQAINGEFPLHRHLGGSSRSAVFLTSYGNGPAQTAAIKLVADNPETSEQQLKRWEMAAGLSHPNLIRLFQAGRCQMDGVQLLYVVMEYAEEDLSQILPQRALTPSEAREMLRPALDALVYLHGTGLVHGRIKPANIMARADQVKLSVDGICRAGEPIPCVNDLDIYDPPDRKHSAASDAWALGTTLVEVLTQRLPVWERSEVEAEPLVPETLAEPFLQIARRCLRRNPSLRLKAADIASRLEPLPAPEPTPTAIASPPDASAKPNYLVWFVALGLLVTAIAASSIRLKHHRHARQTSPIAVSNPKPQKQADEVAAGKTPAPAPAPAVEQPVLQAEPQKKADETIAEKPAAPVPAIEQPVLRAEAQPAIQPVEELKIAAPVVAVAQNEVQDGGIHQVLPDVLQKARDTIRGTVRTSVKVSVDPDGRVTDAALDSPGPSAYFANLALKAARQWSFGPASVSNATGPREWILHFAFTPSGTRARAVQTAP